MANKNKNQKVKLPDPRKIQYIPQSGKKLQESYSNGLTVYKKGSDGSVKYYQKDQKPITTNIESPIRKFQLPGFTAQENAIVNKLTIPTQKLNYSYNPESIDDVAQMTAWLRLYGNGNSDYEDLAAAVQNPGSKYYQPYWKGRSTQTAAQDFFRENFGYEGAFDDKFFEDYLYLQQYTPRSDATGKLIQPGKNSTLMQQAGYWFTCLDMDRDVQHEVNGEWADLRKNTESRFADFKTMYGREPSYDEFIDLVDISSYNQLSKIDASRNLGGYDSSAVVQLNTGTNYSHEALAGMYHVLCNGGSISEDRDYFEDAVSYYLEGASEKAAVEDASASVLSQYSYDVNNITDENYAQALSKAAKIGDMKAYAAIERYHWAQNAAPNVDTTDYFGARFGYYHDDAWFDAAGAIYEPIVKSMSLQDGSVQAPTKKDAPIYHAAYQYYLIKKNRGVTDELEAEYKAFTNDVQQYAEECKKYGNSYENYEYHIWNERLNKENYPNLVKYLADDLDTCRPVLIDKAGIENLIKSSYDSTQGTEDTPETVDDASNADVQQPEGNSVGFLTSPTYITPPMTDVAFSSEGASKQGAATTPEATPSPFPLGHETSSAGDSANTPQPVTLSEDYLNDQVQASAYEHTKRVDDARNKVESALALARSGATVNINQFAESGVPLTGIIDDDDTNNLIVAMWKELQKDYYEDTLGKEYTDAQIEAIDPVYKALVDGTGCTGDAKITPKALEDLYIQECISETSSSALLGGIATYFLGSEAMDDLIDKINSDNEKALISAYAFSQGTAIDVVAYKKTFDNLIDKGYTEQAARETAYYESVFGSMHPTKVFLEAEAELSEAENAAAQSIQSEEAYPDNQVLSGTIINRLISEGLFDSPEKVAEIAAEIHEDLMMGLSELAPSTFNAATKALINDIESGVITPQDVSDGFAAAQEERNQRLMAEAANESKETQNESSDTAAETPEEKPKGNALQSFLNSINAYVSGSKAQEDHSEMFAAIGYDYGGLSIDNRCYEEQGRSKFVDTWNNRIADFVDDTEILTGIEAAAQKYGHGKNYGTDRDNDALAKEAPVLEGMLNNDLSATVRAAVGGLGMDKTNERYLVKSAIRTNGIYFTYDEMNALYQAWNRGYITYDGFKEVLNNRKSSVTPQTANAAFHASMLEDSNVQRNERIASMRGMLTDTKIGRLDSDTSLLVNEFMTAYDNLIQSGSDAASIAYTLSNGKYAPLLDLIGMKPEDIDADNYTDAILKLKEIKSAPATDTYILSNGVDGGYYTAEQIDAIDKLSECVASCGAQGYDLISSYTPEELSDVTGGQVDLKSVGLNGSLSDYMDDVFGEEWQYPYSNTGMDVVSVINNGLLSGYQSVLFLPAKILHYGAEGIGAVTGLGKDTSKLGNAYKEFEAANKEQSSTRLTSGENVASTLISMLPKYVLNSAIGTGLANAAESAFYGAETTKGLTRIADNAMSANGMQRLVSDLVVGTKESAVGSGTSLVAADPSQKLDVIVGAYQSYVNNGYVLDAVKLARRIPYALQEFNYTTDRDLQKGQDIVTSITRGLLNASLELLMPNPLADKPAYSSGGAVSFINATDPIAVNNGYDAWRAVEAVTRSNVLGVPAKTLTGVTQLCDSIFKELRVEMLKDAGEVILDATRDTQFKSEDGFGAYFSSLASNIIGNVGKYGEEYVSKYLSMAASISLINAVQMGVAKLDDFLSNDPVGRIKKLFVDYPDECDYHDPFANARVEAARKEAYEEAYSKRPESAEDINVKSPDAGSAEVLDDSAGAAATEPVKATSAEGAEAKPRWDGWGDWKRKPFDYSIFESKKPDGEGDSPLRSRDKRGADPLAEIVEEAMTSDTPSEDLDAELLLTLARLGVTTEALKELAETQPEVLVRVGDALLAQVGSGDPVLQPKTFGEDGSMPRNGVISAQNYAAMAEGGKRDIIVEQAIDTAKKNYLEQDASLRAIGEAKQRAAREAEEKRQAVIEIGDQIVQQTMSLEGVLRAAAAMNVDFNSPSVRDPMTGLQQSIAALESKQADAQKAADKAIQAAEDADAKYNDAVQRAEAQFDANIRPGMKDDLEARYDAAQAYIVQRKAQESIAVSEDNPKASGEFYENQNEDGRDLIDDGHESKYDKRPEYTPEQETAASREVNLMQELDTRVNSLTTAVKKALQAGGSSAATMMTPVEKEEYNSLIGIAKRIPAARDLIPMLFKSGYDDGEQGDPKYGTTGYARDRFSGNFDVLYNQFGMIPYAESDDYIILQNPAASPNGYIYSEQGMKARGSAAFDDYSAGENEGKARYYNNPDYLEAKQTYDVASATRAERQKEAQAKRVALQGKGISPEEKLQLKQDIAAADAEVAELNDTIAAASGKMHEIKNREGGIFKQPYIVIRKSDYAALEGSSALEDAIASAQAETADNIYLHAVTDYSRDQLIDMIVEATGVSGDVETKLRANLADKRLYPTETDLATELLQTYADRDTEAISQGKASSVPFVGFQKEADLKQFIAENGGWRSSGGNFDRLRPEKTFRVNTVLLHLLGMYKSYASGAATDSYSNPADAALAKDIASLNVGSEEEFFGAIFDMYNNYMEPDKSQTGTNFETDGTGSNFAPSDPFARNPKGESKTTYYAPTDTDGKKTLYVNPNRRNYDLNGARKGEAPVYTIAKAENLVRKLYHGIATGNNSDARIIVYENGGFGGDAGRTTPRIVGAEYKNPETGEMERYLPPVEDIVNGKSKYEVMYRLPIKDSDGKQKYTAADFIVTNTDWNGDFSDIDYSRQAMVETANALKENPNASSGELADHIRTYLIQREGDLRKQIHEILRSARYSKDKEGVIAAAENVKALTAKRDGIRAVLDSSDEELVSFAQKHGILPETQTQDVDDTSVMLPNPAKDKGRKAVADIKRKLDNAKRNYKRWAKTADSGQGDTAKALEKCEYYDNQVKELTERLDNAQAALDNHPDMIRASSPDEFALKAAEAALSSEEPDVLQATKYSRYVQSDEVSAAIQKAVWKAIDKIATKDMNPLQRANYYSLRADSALAKAPNSGLYQDYQTEVAKAMEEAGIVPTSQQSTDPAKLKDADQLFKKDKKLVELETKKGKLKLDEELEDPETVKRFRGDYFFLSNSYAVTPITYDGATYKSAEAAFQAARCANPEDRKQFEGLNADDAKALGKTVKPRPDWESVKDDVMREILQEKFKPGSTLRLKLDATGDRTLIEGNRRGDGYWGYDLNAGSGENKLGTILMEIRDSGKSKNTTASSSEGLPVNAETAAETSTADTPKPVESASTAIDTTASENPTKEATEPTEPETPARIAIDTTESEDEKSALEEFADLKREADDFPSKVEEEVSSGAKPKYEPMKPDENTRLSDDPNAEYSVPFAKSVLRHQEQRLKDLQEQINSMEPSRERSALIEERNNLKQTLIHNRTVHFSREEVVNALEGRAEYDPYKPVSTSGGKLTPRNAFKKLGKLLGDFAFGDRTTFSTKQLADAFGELFDPQYIQNHKEASTHVYEAYARQRSENLRYQYELALIENALNGDTEASRKILAEKEAEYVNAHVDTVKLRGGAPSDYERFRFEKMRVRAEAQETIDTMKAEWNPDASKDDLNARHHTLTDTTYGLIATTQKKMDALKRSYNALNAFGNKDMKSILSGSFGGRLPVPIVNVMLGAVVDATNGSAKNLQKFMADMQESMRIIGIPENDLAPMMNDILNAVPFDESFARIYGDYDSEDGTAVAARGMYGEGYRIAQNAYKKYIDKYGNPKGGITSLFDTMERWVDATFGANAPIINSMFITPALEASDKVNAETTALLEEIDKNIPSKKMSVIAPDSGRHVDMNVREIVGYIMNSYMQNPDVPELYKNGKLDAGDYCKYMYGQLGLDKEQAKEIDGYIAYASAIGRGLLVLENETLIRNGQEPIAMRGNGMYFPSTRDNRSKIEKLLGVNFQITDPPLGVEGNTENTRATHEFNQTKLERKGDAADLDIFNAYRRVAHSIFSTIRMTDHVVRIRQFTEAIRGNIATAEDGSKLHETPMADGYYRNQPMVENSMGGSAAARAVGIAAQFDSFADNLAGKSTPGTRVLQKHFGRKIDQVMRVLQSYSSMVLLGCNVRSAFSNAVPIARMMCIAPREVLTAFRDTLKNLYGGETDDVQRNSDFLRARSALSTEETSFIPQKVKDILFAPMQIIDDIAAGTVMRAYYDVCRNKGYTHEEAIRQAETFSRRMLATKTKAARPQIYNNQFFAWLFQYGLESLNDFNFTMKDLPSIVAGVHGAIPSGEADTSTPDEGVEGLNAPKRTKISASGKIHYGATVIGLAIVAALYNLLNGTGSVDDPVGAAVQAVNETDADAPWYEKGFNALKAAAIEAFPLSDRLGLDSGYGSGIESLMPPSVQFVKSYIDDIGTLISELGEDEFDSDSYMTLVDVLTGMLPAGTQLGRTAHGVNDLVRGYSTTNSGKVKFPVDQDNPINWFMLPIFGSNSAKNKEAIGYYLGENQSLTQSQSDTYKMFVENGIDPSVAYQSVMNWNDAKSASSYADKAEKMTDKEMGEVMAADAEGKNARSEVEVPSDMAPWAVKALESDANVQKGVELYREFGVKTYPVEFKPTSVDGKNYVSVDGKLYPMEGEDLSTVEADYKAQYAAAIRRYNDSGTTEAERRANAEKLEKEISQINTIIKKMIVNRKEGNHNGKK